MCRMPACLYPKHAVGYHLPGFLMLSKKDMMVTEAQIKRAKAAYKKCFSSDSPVPLPPEHLQQFRRSCLEEAKRLMAFLGKRLTKAARKHIEHRVLGFAGWAAQSSVTLGGARSLAPLFGRTLTQLKNLE